MDTLQVFKSFENHRENLIPLLHALQDNHPQNYLPSHTLVEVAKFLKVPLATVHGVVGYYSMFSAEPRGRYIMRLCSSPVCHLSGAQNAVGWLSQLLKVNLGETTPDGFFTLEESECLGRCGESPAIMINRDFYGNLSLEKLEKIVDSLTKAALNSKIQTQ